MLPHTPPKQLSPRHAGWTCAACQQPLRETDQVCECTQCGAPQHEACWIRLGACQAYECRPSGQAAPAASEGIKITTSEVKDVQVETIDTPRGVGSGKVHLARYVPRHTSRMAIVACILGAVAVPLFGVTGIPAVVVGGLALASVYRDKALKGALWASLGLALGSLSTVGWLLFLVLHLWNRHSPEELRKFEETRVSLSDATPEVRSAMERNVRISLRDRLGSGIVYASEAGKFSILTNRHVIDPGYESGSSGDGPARGSGGISVHFYNGVSTDATVEWIAPHGIDLALVSCPREGLDIPPAPIDTKRPLHVGDDVYAVGNPEGLGWTLTKGYVSAFRTMQSGPTEVRLVQTQTPINPGNSGGGLYDKEGWLVGVNTLKSGGGMEGLNFAISIQTAVEVLPAREEAPKPR